MRQLKATLALLTAMCAALVLAACGGDDSSGYRSEQATGGGGSFPVTVKHKFGETQIDTAPRRVVALGYTDQDPVLSVDVVPVGVGDFLGGYDWRNRPWAKAALAGAKPKVVGGQQINFDAVANAAPDVIIAINAGLKKADYERLSRIAPTVGQSGDYIDFGMPWDEQQALIGDALGRSEQAGQVIGNLKDRFAEIREEQPEFEGKTAVLAFGGPDGYGAYATADTRSRFLTDLGLKVPKEIDDLAKDAFFAEFSQEHFRLLDQDLVFMYGNQEEIESNSVVSRLDAVKEGRVIYIPLNSEFAGALGFASALSQTFLLDNYTEQIAAAIDGDPATKVQQPK